MLRSRRIPAALVAALLLGACAGTDGAAPDPAVPASGAATTVPGGSRPPGTAADGADSPVERIAEDDTIPGRGNPAIDVRHYDLAIDYDPDTDELAGEATLDVRAVESLGGDEHPTIDLDLRELTVDEVTVDGEPAEATLEDDKLRIDAPEIDAGTGLTIVVRYHGEPRAVPTTALPGVSVGWTHGGRASMVLAEPDGAHSWFPLNDHPLDKATYTFAVTVPQPLVAVANGRLDGTEDHDDGARRTWRWTMDAPMAGYLASVVTGELEVTGEDTVDGVAYSSWLPPGSGVSARSVELQQRVVARLADRLGPFPFDTYGAVVYDDEFVTGADDATRKFMGGVALEVQGRSLYAVGAFEPSTIIHETAHQWFGNSVSLTAWGDDIWWVEGFATFAQDAFAGDGDPAEALADARPGYRRNWSSCDGEAVDDLAARDLFWGPSYECGALVFYALWAELGDDTFWEGLRTFQERHRHANADTDDLIAALSDAAGRDLESFVRSWLSGDRPALP